VEPIELAAVSPAGAYVLTQRYLEHGAGQRSKSKGIGAPELCELGTKAVPPGLPVSASEETMTRGSLATWPRRAAECTLVTHRVALRLLPEELEQGATVNPGHAKARSPRRALQRSSANSRRTLVSLFTVARDAFSERAAPPSGHPIMVRVAHERSFNDGQVISAPP